MLSDSLNWNIGVRMTIRGKRPNKKIPKYVYSRIRHSVPITTRILVGVGTASQATWKYGGQARIFLNSSPSSTSQFVGGIMVAESPLPIARSKLFDLSYLPPASYAIEIVPPYWFPYVSIESWWYDGEPVGLEKDIKDTINIITQPAN